jgi:DNA-binding HxlR family transcriptional regulator
VLASLSSFEVEAPSQAERAGRARASIGASEPDGPVRVCPDFHRAVELIGKRWAGAIIWVLSERSLYFAELSQAVPGVSDRLLSRRLRELEAEGLVRRSVHSGARPRVSYALTKKGVALEPAIRELRAWGRHWNCD